MQQINEQIDPVRAQETPPLPRTDLHPFQIYVNHQQLSWLTAARELISRHPRQRLQRALDYMLTDEILASRTLTLPGFAKVVDQLLARSHARRRIPA